MTYEIHTGTHETQAKNEVIYDLKKKSSRAPTDGRS